MSALTLDAETTTDNAPAPSNGIDKPEVKFQFPRQGEWTYDHWLQFPHDGWKYEIIDGVLYMSPPPTINHQDVALN